MAHVTVRVDNPAPEAFAKYTVRVPNEAEEAATTKIEVELPEEFAEARIQPLAGWDISITDGVLVIAGGRIGPGQFQEFAFSARNPAAEGDLVMPAIQTYDDGEVVRWVGATDAEEPAPVVTIAGESADHGAAEGSEAGDEHGTDPEPQAAAAAPVAPSGGTDTLSIVALIAGVLGLALGGAAFARSRR